ncbi:hypothetical protein CY34DRAFT_340384 [Suillus luteus UH-Slu-Lm8-n1]|uniref:Uncharacterized protein n=1 Tax=Suillus luteus UH-Slu-Lm8-n1 TaxID=930992 RepID=A0A0D0AC69_9AGAM|nr:hypothetical protein CY34DRAFT_340384 [Suillus luteus UH-Slu-Lm8-n1]
MYQAGQKPIFFFFKSFFKKKKIASVQNRILDQIQNSSMNSACEMSVSSCPSTYWYSSRRSNVLEEDDRISIYMKHVTDLRMTRMGRQLGRKQARNETRGSTSRFCLILIDSLLPLSMIVRCGTSCPQRVLLEVAIDDLRRCPLVVILAALPWGIWP